MSNLIDFFKACSDETRLRLLLVLKQKTHCVCELSGILSLSQPKVSKHLAKLKYMKFVETKRDAQFIYYGLSIQDPVILHMLDEILENIEAYPMFKQDLMASIHSKTAQETGCTL